MPQDTPYTVRVLDIITSGGASRLLSAPELERKIAEVLAAADLDPKYFRSCSLDTDSQGKRVYRVYCLENGSGGD